MKNIILFGAGLHVQYCIDTIEKEGKYKIIGITDSIKPIGTELYGYKIIGRQEHISELVEKYNIAGGIITIGDNWSRKFVNDFIVSKVPNFNFVNAIHPSTIIGSNVTMGVGNVIMAGVIINPGAIVRNFCFFATGAQLEHDSFLDDYASISAGVVTGGKVSIGKYSAITLGVTILDRIKIGENVVIGAGSLVIKDVPDNVVAYGSPAKIIRTRKVGEKYLKSEEE
ncbi:MAG: NeuD/PglB/VioB family sugar acetyltransferase [Ignavibacteriaceae bacterium]